jgi:hypothetical protein
MTLTIESEIAGLPIIGTPQHTKNPTQQRSRDEFEQLIRPLLDSPRISSIRWEQCTPYYNDGDVCEFGVGDLRFAGPDLNDADNDDYGDDHLSLWNVHLRGGQPSRYVRSADGWGAWEDYGDVLPPHPDYEIMQALAEPVSFGSFDELLMAAFGDHAVVTIYSDRITVESYDHD